MFLYNKDVQDAALQNVLLGYVGSHQTLRGEKVQSSLRVFVFMLPESDSQRVGSMETRNQVLLMSNTDGIAAAAHMSECVLNTFLCCALLQLLHLNQSPVLSAEDEREDTYCMQTLKKKAHPLYTVNAQ